MSVPITVILDTGASIIKAGFAGENEPRCIFPTIIGRPKNPVKTIV
jgi:hypothetical protein